MDEWYPVLCTVCEGSGRQPQKVYRLLGRWLSTLLFPAGPCLGCDGCGKMCIDDGDGKMWAIRDRVTELFFHRYGFLYKKFDRLFTNPKTCQEAADAVDAVDLMNISGRSEDIDLYADVAITFKRITRQCLISRTA